MAKSLIEIKNSRDGRKYFTSIVEVRKVIRYQFDYFGAKQEAQLLITIEAAILSSKSLISILSPLFVVGYALSGEELGFREFCTFIESVLQNSDISLMRTTPDRALEDPAFDALCRQFAVITQCTSFRSLPTFRQVPYVVLLDRPEWPGPVQE